MPMSAVLFAALLAQVPQTTTPPQTPVTPPPTVQAPVPTGPSTLRWTPKEGDEIKYRTVAELTVGGNAATLTSVNTHKVIRVDPDGTYTVQATPTEAKVMMLGQEMQGAGMTTITTYGASGEVREIRGDKLEATGYRMANLTAFHAPTKPVNVGDAWTAEGKADPKTGAVAWKVDYKVVGEETVGPFSALKLDVVARETEGSDAGKATGSVWITRDGIVARSEFNWNNVVVPGAPVPVSGKITLTRLS